MMDAMVKVEAVSKSFGNVRALIEVSLEVERGERVALVGSNGSGKTTLLRALLGLVRVQGKVSIEGCDVAQNPERALARVAYVPQVAPPLEAPVREVLRVTASLRRIRTEAIEHSAAELGLCVAQIAERRVRDLSGGMKQKMLAALALASDPDLLICDEPTANLDSRARERFFGLVDARRTERALILCSHRAEDVERLVDRVVELAEGRVVSDTNIGLRYSSTARAVVGCEERLSC